MAEGPRFFVIGCGSIGQRHIGNLKSLGVADILAFDVRSDRRAETEAQFGVPTIDTLDAALGTKPDVALVAVPTNLHVPVALDAARQGCHLFVEKPLGHQLDGLDELLGTVSKHGMTAMVGCNMRFHHGPSTIQRLVNEGAVGRVITSIIDFGQYLPDWHPAEDYRKGYSANASLGGGIVLDGIHEIDYARWLFGEVDEVYCHGGKASSLEIDTEDSVNILMRTVSGVGIVIHMDYLQRAYWRTCKVVGEEGTIYWDMASKTVRLYSASNGGWRTFPEPDGYTVNDMYLDEMRHFLSCLRGEDAPELGLGDAKRVLQIALAVKESMHTGEPRRLAARQAAPANASGASST